MRRIMIKITKIIIRAKTITAFFLRIINSTKTMMILIAMMMVTIIKKITRTDFPIILSKTLFSEIIIIVDKGYDIEI